MKMVLAPLRAWINGNIRLKNSKQNDYVLSEEPIKISGMILEMTSRFLVMS